MIKLSRLIFFILLAISTSLIAEVDLKDLHLPPGFSIAIYAKVPNARQMTLGDQGIVYVGTKKNHGNVYALLPNKERTQAEKVITIASGLYMPNGVAYRNGNLYVAAVDKVYRFNQIGAYLEKPVFEVINDTFPENAHHGWRYIRFAPDNKLYIAVGAPCNVCESKDPRFASIMRIDENGRNPEIYARGIRNSVGFDWNPSDNTLWFTDNGTDWLGDDIPPDELNRAPKPGMHFGFPYFYGNNVPDPKFGKNKSSEGFTIPVQNLNPHSATLGMVFYNGKMFPQKYQKQIFIAEHGSWNRRKKIGYRVSLVTLEGNKPKSYESFITGWLRNEKVSGRPVDLMVMPDGALLLSDDYSGTIYRITYQK